MRKLNYKVSYHVLYVLLGIIGVAFLLFFSVGFDMINPEFSGEYSTPLCTDVILVLMIVLTLLTLGLLVWSVVNSVRETPRKNVKDINGMPSVKIILFSVGALLFSLLLGLVTHLTDQPFVSRDNKITSAFLVTVTDTLLWSMFLLLIVSTAVMVVNMTGCLKSKELHFLQGKKKDESHDSAK
jgi:uncharacterized membrane protein YidH (DUF202 family)